MHKIIISDASCFIVLANINELHLLQKTYGKIITTSVVASEFGQVLPQWVEIKEVSNKTFQRILELQLDKGEASTIALALENPGSVLILDDYKGRTIAKKLKLEITGTIGVVIKAKLRGVIPSIKPILDKIKRTNFRLSEQIEREALEQSGEQPG